MSALLSVVIPSRNETYLRQTILGLLDNAIEPIEVIAVLDGYWPPQQEIVEDTRVKYIHFSQARGMRNAINTAVSISRGTYILKIDAHCLVDKGYDQKLKASCQNNWVVVPRRYALNVQEWKIEENPKYPIDHMSLSDDLHGIPTQKRAFFPIEDLMTFQGSCWFMKRSYYDYLELMDEEHYGKFWHEAQEIGLKAWLSGGRVVVNSDTWYAHWHKPRSVGRGYSLDHSDQKSVTEYVMQWRDKKMWHKQTKDFDWLADKFKGFYAV